MFIKQKICSGIIINCVFLSNKLHAYRLIENPENCPIQNSGILSFSSVLNILL